MTTNYEVVIGFFNIIAVIGYLSVALYIYKVRRSECPCAEGWKQTTMFLSSLVLAIISFLTVIACSLNTYGTFIKKHPIVDLLIITSSISYVALSYFYIQELNSKECECSNNLHIILIAIIKFIMGLIVTYSIFFIILLIIAALSLSFIATTK